MDYYRNTDILFELNADITKQYGKRVFFMIKPLDFEVWRKLINNYRYYLIVDNKPIVESKECTNKFIELERTLEAYHKLDDYEKHTLFINKKENK